MTHYSSSKSNTPDSSCRRRYADLPLNPDQIRPDDDSRSSRRTPCSGLKRFTRAHRFRACCFLCFLPVVLVSLAVLLAVMGILVSQLSTASLDHSSDPWPVTDDDGYYQSYKEAGRWVNYWQRSRPSFLEFGAMFAVTSDLSGVSESFCSMTGRVSCNVDTNLPVLMTYWRAQKHPLSVAAQLSEGNTSRFAEFQKRKRVFAEPGVRATWIGHATVLAEVDGSSVLCDPVFSERCSPFSFMGPKRYRPPACEIDELPEELDAVLISHTHYDHMDSQSIVDLHKKYGDRLHWYVPSGSGSFFSDVGVPKANIHEMVWWEESVLKPDPGRETQTRIVFTPSNHWSRRGLFDENKALWGSWTILGRDGNRFWFGGDTAYSDVFKQIGRRFGPFNLAAIPIGAYHPRETLKYVHVNPEEAVKIHKDIRSLRSLGIHWGTFRLTYEYYLEPRTRIQDLVAKEGSGDDGQDKLQFYNVAIGGTLDGRSAASEAAGGTQLGTEV